MAVSGVAVLINYDKTAHKNYLLTKCSSPRIVVFFRVIDGAEFGEQLEASIRAIEFHYTCEVDRSVAGLQNSNGVVCSRTEMTHYV